MAFLITFTIIFLGASSIQTQLVAGDFHKFYSYLWGNNHFSIDPQGNQVSLLMDSQGGAGFKSKHEYGSGLFHIKIKTPDKKTEGIVTSFYVTSAPDYQDPSVNHFEIDFEFLGTNGSVQTNVYNNDGGHREQTFNLWFNPSKDFHTYEILWNTHQIVFRIDQIPVRVFKNNSARGIDYPWRPMHIEGSVWHADWAGSVNYTQAPFITYYQDFNFNACPAQGQDVSTCASNRWLWNQQRFWEINDEEKSIMSYYRERHMIYDYCSSPATRKPECSFN